MNLLPSNHHPSSLSPHPLSLGSGALLPPRDGRFHHILVNGDYLAVLRGRFEFETANHAPESLAQRAGAEAFLAGGIPGDGDERAARDLQIDSEALKVGARSAEDRTLRLDEDAREIGLVEI